MRKRALLRLVAGFRRFHQRYFETENSPYRRLAGAQTPSTLVIGCSDSRVDPAIISDAGPGELFVIRNVANLVPPFEQGSGLHGTSAAIEFAVVNLKVEHIVVLGHRQCGRIRALVTGLPTASVTFIDQWMEIARSAHFRTLAAYPDADVDTICHHCEMESIRTSIEKFAHVSVRG